MKKVSLLLALGVAVVLGSAATPKANAGVVVGVAVGTPVYPVRPYFAPRPYVAYGPAPVYPRVYVPHRRFTTGTGIQGDIMRAEIITAIGGNAKSNNVS